MSPPTVMMATRAMAATKGTPRCSVGCSGPTWRSPIPVLVFSDQIQEWLNYDLSFTGSGWIAPVLGTVIYFYGGRPFLTGGSDEARQRQPAMMLLIALGDHRRLRRITAVADRCARSRVLVGARQPHRDHAARPLAGDEGDRSSPRCARRAGRTAAGRSRTHRPQRRHRSPSPSADLQVGDRLLVRSGARIPADGTIVDGAVEVDESMLTGESNPVAKSEGDDVVAGSVATDNIDPRRGHRRRRRHRTRRHPTPRRRSPGLQLAGPGHSPTEPPPLLFYVAITAAAITAIVWLAARRTRPGPDPHHHRADHRLPPRARPGHPPRDLAVDGAGRPQRHPGQGPPRTRTHAHRRHRLFDKTGTLTAGEHVVTDFARRRRRRPTGCSRSPPRSSPTANTHSPAPSSATPTTPSVEPADATDFQSMTGRGVHGNRRRRTVAIGGPSLLRCTRTAPHPPNSRPHRPVGSTRRRRPPRRRRRQRSSERSPSKTRSAPNPDSAVDALHDRGITRRHDHRRLPTPSPTTSPTELGIDDVFAEVLPEDKDQAVERPPRPGPHRGHGR